MQVAGQVRRFILTGAVNTLVGYLLYSFAIVALGLPYFWAVLFSYGVGVTFSYFTFHHFVFSEGARGWQSYLRFVQTYVFIFLFNLGALFVMVDVLGWHALVAQLIVIPACAALSFVINKVFVFKSPSA